jgi:hypothetical protein
VKKLALMLLLSPGLLALGQKHKTPVALACTCDDPVGREYATALRDLLSASPRYELADDYGKALFKINVVSMDPTSDDEGISAALSSAFLVGPQGVLLSHTVQWCPIAHASSCARSTFSYFDQMLNDK